MYNVYALSLKKKLKNHRLCFHSAPVWWVVGRLIIKMASVIYGRSLEHA